MVDMTGERILLVHQGKNCKDEVKISGSWGLNRVAKVADICGIYSL